MLTTSVMVAKANRNEEAMRDPRRHTAADTLTTEEFHRCIAYLDARGPSNTQAVKYNSLMKTCRGALYKGDDARRLSWGDFFITTLPNTAVGRDPSHVLCMLSKGGKTNQ